MKNFEKYRTAEERYREFGEYCKAYKNCAGCKLFGSASTLSCAFAWLDLEVEVEKPMPCPFCGNECVVQCVVLGGCEGTQWYTVCHNNNCLYRSSRAMTTNDAISNHNRICRAVKAAKESGVK